MNEKLFKLTKRDNTTYNGCKWGKNIIHSVEERDRSNELCTSGVIHAYRNLNLALLLNPIHGKHIPPNIWEAEGKVIAKDWGKAGTHELTTVKRIKQPIWYAHKTIRKKVQIQFAILCAEAVLKYFENKYPDDKRPREAIEAAKKCLRYASKKSADAAYAAAYAADAAEELDFCKLTDKAVKMIME